MTRADFVAVRRRLWAIGLQSGRMDEDLLGDALLAWVEAMRRYDPARGTAPETWATHRARGAILDQRRARRGRYRRRPITVSLDLAPVVDPTPLPDDLADGALQLDAWRRLFHARLARLPHRQRQLLLDTYHGRTLDESAADLGVCKSAACRLRQRARAQVAA